MTDFRRLNAGLSLREDRDGTAARISGGRRRWDDIKQKAPSFLEEDELEKKNAALEAEEAEDAVKAVRDLNKGYDGYLSPKDRVEPEPVDLEKDRDLPFRNGDQAADAVRAAGSDKAQTDILQKRLGASPVFPSNKPASGGLRRNMTVEGLEPAAPTAPAKAILASHGAIQPPEPERPTPPFTPVPGAPSAQRPSRPPAPKSPPPAKPPVAEPPKPPAPTEAPDSAPAKRRETTSRLGSAAGKAGKAIVKQGLKRAPLLGVLWPDSTAAPHGPAEDQTPLPGDRALVEAPGKDQPGYVRRERADGSIVEYAPRHDPRTGERFYEYRDGEIGPDDPLRLYPPAEKGGAWRANEKLPFRADRFPPVLEPRTDQDTILNSGDPRDDWIPDDAGDLSEIEIAERLKTIDSGTVEWMSTDTDGKRRRKRYPVFILPKSVWPDLYEEDVKAPNISDGVPNFWRYGKHSKEKTNQIRDKVQRAFGLRRGQRHRRLTTPVVQAALAAKYGGSPSQYQLDAHEAVPAAFEESASAVPGGYGRVSLQERNQNQDHGRVMGRVLKSQGVVRKGQWVIYIVVDDTKDPEKWKDF